MYAAVYVFTVAFFLLPFCTDVALSFINHHVDV